MDHGRHPDEQEQDEVDHDVLVANSAMEEDCQRRQKEAQENLDNHSNKISHGSW